MHAKSKYYLIESQVLNKILLASFWSGCFIAHAICNFAFTPLNNASKNSNPLECSFYFSTPSSCRHISFTFLCRQASLPDDIKSEKPDVPKWNSRFGI